LKIEKKIFGPLTRAELAAMGEEGGMLGDGG
jgi:hypothetical protein